MEEKNTELQNEILSMILNYCIEDGTYYCDKALDINSDLIAVALTLLRFYMEVKNPGLTKHEKTEKMRKFFFDYVPDIMNQEFSIPELKTKIQRVKDD